MFGLGSGLDLMFK